LGPAVFCIIYPLARESSDGWSLSSDLLIALAVVLLCSFFAYERHAEKQAFALVPLRMFREPAFSNGLALRAAFSAGATAMFLCLSYYLQEGMGLSPLSSGLMFVALGVGYVTSAILTKRILARWWGRIVMFGSVLQCASFVALLGVVTYSGPRRLVAVDVCLWVFGTAQGLISTASNPITLHGLRAEDAGSASGVLLTMQTVANSIGVATIGTVYISVVHGYGHQAFHGLAQLHHYGHAYEVALFILIGLTVPLFVLGARLPRSAYQADRESKDREQLFAALD
jgi:predicted MFS family arabinose efflux permease